MSNGHQTFCAVVNETLLLFWLRAKPWLCVNSNGHLEHSLGKSFSPSDPQNCCTANKHKVLHCHHTAAAGAATPSPHTGKHKPVQLHLHLWTNRLPEPSSERYLVFMFFFFLASVMLTKLTFYSYCTVAPNISVWLWMMLGLLKYHFVNDAVYSRGGFNEKYFKQTFF